MLKVEHIGIAVKDFANAIPLFEQLLDCECYKQEEVSSEHVKTAFFRQGETKIELLQSTTNGGVIDKFIQRKGEGIHHIAFEVADIRAEVTRLKSLGFRILNEEPRPGADNKLVCFLHPASTNSVLIELCMSMPQDQIQGLS